MTVDHSAVTEFLACADAIVEDILAAGNVFNTRDSADEQTARRVSAVERLAAYLKGEMP